MSIVMSMRRPMGASAAMAAAIGSLLPAAHMAEAEHAAQAIIRISHEHAGRLLLVALGPLTNVALALKLDPSLPSRVARLVVMGGAVNGRGNITPFAEFNTHFDPEAAHLVFEAFETFDLADWEATLAHGFLHADVDAWCSADSERARFYDAISRQTRAWSGERRGERWHSADSLAMAFALAPEQAETATHRQHARHRQSIDHDHGPEARRARVGAC